MFESRLAAAREKLKEALGVEATEEHAGGRDLRRSYGTPPRKATAARRLSSARRQSWCALTLTPMIRASG
eukprot:7211438-Prymnesium_polylepis.1